MLFFNRTLPLIVAFAFGMLGIVIFYIPHSAAQSVEREMALWVRIVFALLKSKSTEIFLGAFAGTQALKLFVTVTVDFSLFSHASAF